MTGAWLIPALAVVLFIAAADILLLVFAGILLGVFLCALTDMVRRAGTVRHSYALALVLCTLATMAGVTVYFAAPLIAEQADRLLQLLPGSVEELRARIAQYEWSSILFTEGGRAQLFTGTKGILARATGVVSGTAALMAGGIIVLFIGIYLAGEPSVYSEGATLVAPPEKRQLVRRLFDEMYTALRHWLLGRIVGMVVVGAATGIGLALMDIPLAPMLGLLTGLLTFIPNLGPIIAGVPVVLIAFTGGTSKALGVAAFYTVVQVLEGYLLTPLILRKTVTLPPALLLAAQAVFGYFWGILGIAMAAPLTAIAIVSVRLLHVERMGRETPDA